MDPEDAEVARAFSGGEAARLERVSGLRLVSPHPGPVHQVAITELVCLLQPWLRATCLGQVVTSPARLSLGERELLQPDLFVFRRTGSPTPEHWSGISGVLLAAEIRSPGTAYFDCVVKRMRYQEAGVPDYWIVDLDARLVDRWRPGARGPEILAERLEWIPDGLRAGISIDLVAFFRTVLGTA
jgi:Uma2 family endonuclease